MKLLNFDSFINESANTIKFINNIYDFDYTTVEVSLKYAKTVGEIFKDTSFKKFGKQTSTNVFEFDKTNRLAEFVEMLIDDHKIDSSELELY